MNIKQGDCVNIEGIESTVETSWAQGKHRVFKLSDGRIILDLDKAVESGAVTIIKPQEELPNLPLKDPSVKKWTL